MFLLQKIIQFRNKAQSDHEKPFLEHLEDLRVVITRRDDGRAWSVDGWEKEGGGCERSPTNETAAGEELTTSTDTCQPTHNHYASPSPSSPGSKGAQTHPNACPIHDPPLQSCNVRIVEPIARA